MSLQYWSVMLFIALCILQLSQALRSHGIRCKLPSERRQIFPCEHGCKDGYRGEHCGIPCYKHCISCDRNTSHCEKCVEGYYETYCNHLCFDKCRICNISGHCEECKEQNVTGSYCETPIQPNIPMTTTPIDPDVTVKQPLPWYTIVTILFFIIMGIVIVSLSLYCWLHICRRSPKNSTNDVRTKALNGYCGDGPNDVEMNTLTDSRGNATNDGEVEALTDSRGNATNDGEVEALTDSRGNATNDDEMLPEHGSPRNAKSIAWTPMSR